jgi:predicted RND superfamily exporter protein
MTAGMAMLVTTIVLVLGFLVLSFSDYEVNAKMGLLTAITLSFALLADFLLLPSILIKLNESNSNKGQRNDL